MKLIRIYLNVLFIISMHQIVISQSGVGVGTTTPHASAKLDITSTAQGALIPRMTTAQRAAIVTPATGLMVYDLDKRTIFLYDGMRWNAMLFTMVVGKLPLSPSSASDGLAGDNFGKTVSIQGNYAIVGAPGNDVAGNADQGSAYIFYKSGEYGHNKQL